MNPEQVEAAFERLGWRWKKAGKGYLISCPYAKQSHSGGTDRNPSFAVWPDINYGKCYSCGRKESLHSLLGLTPSEREDPELLNLSLSMREKENEPLQALDPGLLSVFSDIPDSGKAYLAGRGFDLGCIEHFSLRFDTSRRAIVFPVYEPSGNLVGCVGRGIEGRRHHNYFNFPTGRTVGGIQKFSPTRGKLALVEGFTDLLNCYQWARDLGFDVCCTWTANLTRDQAILIADTGKRIHCWFDQDPAGRKGFETVQRLLEDSDYGLTRAVWPDENLDVGAMNRDTFYSIFSR